MPGVEFSFFGLFSFEFSKLISKFLELTERYSSLSESSESISFFSILFSEFIFGYFGPLDFCDIIV